MNRAIIVFIGIAVAALGAASIVLSPSINTTTIPLPEPGTQSGNTVSNSSRGVTVVADKLQVPWSIDIAGDGRMVFTERTGKISVIDANGKLLENPLANIRVESVEEAGLLGVALHPNFTRNHILYIYHTYSIDGKLYNKVLLLVEKDNRVTEARVILDGIPGAAFHNGGRLKFGPYDGKLYVSTGDAQNPEQAQDIKSLAGKILRINPDGSIPTDNPFPNSPIFSFGHRNIQGLAWHPVTKELYAIEHGPTGNDEINIIKPGHNYGWPVEACKGDGKFDPAIICFNPAIAPAGATFAGSDRLGYKNDLIISTLKGSHLRLVDFETKAQNNILVGYGRLRDVIEAPDGSLYVLTSNKDGRGIPSPDDDKILKIAKP
jgi:glucose/arabinose dehydrogenase